MRFLSVLAKWQSFASASPLRRLGQDAMVAAAASIASRAVGFAKELVVAAHFGLSGNLDVYFVAFALIGFPLAILLNAIQTVFIAKLSAHSSSVEDQRLFGLTALGTLFLLLLVLPLWLAVVPYGVPWLASGFPPEKRHALETALTWLIPYYFINGINLLGYGVLQAKRRYMQNGLLPVATPLIIVLTLLFVGANDGWHVLVATLVAGAALECALLFFTLHRMGLLGVPRVAEWKAARMVFSGSLALLPATVVGALVMLVEQSIAASMGEGSNAALAYGLRLPAALQSLFVTAIGITALPYFAALLAKGQHGYCLHSLKKLSWVLWISGMVIAFPLVIFSAEITSLLYQRGVFDPSAVARVAPIQAAYFVQIPFVLLSMLCIKTLAALGRNVEVGMLSAMAGILQCMLAYELTQRFNVIGIAWAATIMSALVAAISLIVARSTLEGRI